MFETVVPEATTRKSRKVFYETLPVSIALHVIVVVAVVVSATWNVSFPGQSPRLARAYILTSIPEPPPPPPPPAAAPAPRVQAPPPPPSMKIAEMAPTVIPDLIPQVPDPTPQLPEPPPPPVTSTVPVEATSTAGSPDGVIGGQIGGVKHGTPGGLVFAEDGKVHIDRNEKLPLKEIDHPYPHYPDGARKLRLEDRCVIRYTIGKNGHVIDINVIEHANNAMFDDESVNTVKQWTFRPLTLNGVKAEVVHEVEFYYQFIQR